MGISEDEAKNKIRDFFEPRHNIVTIDAEKEKEKWKLTAYTLSEKIEVMLDEEGRILSFTFLRIDQ